ncbi:MAG TPA: NUDIX domain-containing protein [Nocardioidaceae bacterium]|nr:NUDIX domain-containing protein [Nocardioidaceae bacterium]
MVVVYTSKYPYFYVTVDLVILTLHDGQLCALVVRRGQEPFRGQWALPGGFVDQDEDLHEAAVRELEEETAVSTGDVRLEQLASFGAPGRDPRHRVVSVAYLAVLPNGPSPRAGSDAAEAGWTPVETLLAGRDELAFDHFDILSEGVERARAKLEYSGLATEFVDDEFTVAELREVYEVVWGRRLDPGNFHRKVTRTPGFVERVGRSVTRGPGRPAELFRFGGAETLYPPMSRSTFG